VVDIVADFTPYFRLTDSQLRRCRQTKSNTIGKKKQPNRINRLIMETAKKAQSGFILAQTERYACAVVDATPNNQLN
jgi:hypothetical protein